jgi:hypothetical protein
MAAFCIVCLLFCNQLQSFRYCIAVTTKKRKRKSLLYVFCKLICYLVLWFTAYGI